MFKQLIAISLRHPGTIIVLGVALVVAAAIRTGLMPVDVFPELNAPTVVVMTEAGGLAADEVERYVTFHIETAVNGLPGVRRVRSSSALSLSMVWVEFDWGTDIYRARQLVAERLSSVREALPESTHIEIAPVSSITGEIMLVSLTTKEGDTTVTPMGLRSFAEFEARIRLLSVPGVSQVVAIGGELPQYRVDVHRDRLLLYDMTIDEVVDAARAANSTASAGLLPSVDGRELPIRQFARVTSPDDLKSALVRYHEGRAVTIGDVATVKMGAALRRGTASDRGRPAVVLSIQKSPGINTLELTRRIDAALDEIEGIAPPGVKMNRNVFKQADFIGVAVDNVVQVTVEAALIVAGILILFLMNVRTTVITLTALPLSVAVALLVMDGTGLTINVMTLGGLAVAIGGLVDDAIIYVENVWRRLRLNRSRPAAERLGEIGVVYRGSTEILASMVFATVIICLVFVPLLFLQGLEGRFFQPLGIAFMVATMASLLVAVTVTPAMCRLLLARKERRAGGLAGEDQPVDDPHERDSAFARLLKKSYRPLLNWSLRWRKTVVAVALAMTGVSLAVAATFGSDFLPEFNEGTFTVFVMAPPGTSLEESDRIAVGVERRLSEVSAIRSVVRRTGRAELDEHAEPVSSSEIEVSVNPGYTREEVREEIDKILAAVPGITTMIGQPIEHRLSHILSGTPAAIAINVFGEDLPTLRRVAKELETALRVLPDARDVNANREVTIVSVPVEYRLAELRAAGLNAADAAEQLSTALTGVEVAVVNDGVRRFPIWVRLAPEDASTPRQLAELELRGRDGARVRLGDVAVIGEENASNLIVHENARRKAVVSCNVAAGSNLGELIVKVQAAVEPIVRRAGCSVTYGGQFEAQQAASGTLGVMGLAVTVVIAGLLAMSMQSLRSATLVLVNLPLAVIGGIAATFVAESPDTLANLGALLGLGGRYQAPVLSVASLVGFITLFGIAVRNGILLLNHYRTLITEEGATPDEAVRRGSEERLIPILMTAICAALGLAPLAMRLGEPGSELLAPLAIVVLGGLVTSTALNLVVVPAGYMLIGAFRDAKQEVAGDSFDEDPLGKQSESRSVSPANSGGVARTAPTASLQDGAHMDGAHEAVN